MGDERAAHPWEGLDMAVPFERSFDGLVGLEHVEVGPERVVGRVAVRDAHFGLGGGVHGGVYAAMSEALTSTGTFIGVYRDGNIATGMSNETTVLEQVTDGTLEATCIRTHAADDLWLWSVEIRDDAGRLCAVTSMTIAVRPMRRTG